jgi:hypothetical protein
MREMQIKTTMGYHFTITTKAIKNKTKAENNKYRQKCGEIGILIY